MLSPHKLKERLSTILGKELTENFMNALEQKFDSYTKQIKLLENPFVGKSATRRDLLKLLFATGAISACASTPSGSGFQAIERNNKLLPDRLPGRKIQRPEEYGLLRGCMMGITYNGHHFGLKEVPKYYRLFTNKELSHYVIADTHHNIFPRVTNVVLPNYIASMQVLAEQSVIPWVRYRSDYGIEEHYKEKNRIVMREFLDGKYDKIIEETAIELRKFGDKFGGFFITTMWEMNLAQHHRWAGSPKIFKKGYEKIWTIFEHTGANEYATWVWNPYVGNHSNRNYCAGIDSYFPNDDRMVDWIGGNGYNFADSDIGGYTSFSRLFYSFYNWSLKNHPNKNIIIAETGCNEYSGKPKWVLNMFSDLETKFPLISGLTTWSEKWTVYPIGEHDTRYDSSPEALGAYKQGSSSKHFLEKIPYRQN